MTANEMAKAIHEALVGTCNVYGIAMNALATENAALRAKIVQLEEKARHPEVAKLKEALAAKEKEILNENYARERAAFLEEKHRRGSE